MFYLIYDMFDGYTWYVQTILNRLYTLSEGADKWHLHRSSQFEGGKHCGQCYENAHRQRTGFQK